MMSSNLEMEFEKISITNLIEILSVSSSNSISIRIKFKSSQFSTLLLALDLNLFSDLKFEFNSNFKSNSIPV